MRPVLAPCRSRARHVLLTCVLALAAWLAHLPAATAAGKAVLIELNGVVGPAAADYIVGALAQADPATTELVILRLDTPGGLDGAMRAIVRAILASPVPVVTYVAPSGARAASAGTYISYAATVAAMAPGTNLGAATPIHLGERNDKTPREDVETRKMVNDAVAYLRSLAELRGRNADWAEEAVRGSVSLPASEALRRHVIELVATDERDLLAQLDGRVVPVAGGSRRLATQGLELVTQAPGWRTRLLTTVTNPNIAYLLLMLGTWGLILEFAHPGTVLPGTVGAISLLLALIGLSELPIDHGGALLALLGMALMVAEIFVGVYGVLAIGGLVALTLGSLMMFHGGGPGLELSLPLVAATTALTAGLVGLGLWLVLGARRRRGVTGDAALIGSAGDVLDWEGAEGRVRIGGELWQARALEPLAPGVRVQVTGRDGLVLTVAPGTARAAELGKG
ncbi:MAG: nodulation protein NfeD [Geminicoccaceae bacterium]